MRQQWNGQESQQLGVLEPQPNGQERPQPYHLEYHGHAGTCEPKKVQHWQQVDLEPDSGHLETKGGRTTPRPSEERSAACAPVKGAPDSHAPGIAPLDYHGAVNSRPQATYEAPVVSVATPPVVSKFPPVSRCCLLRERRNPSMRWPCPFHPLGPDGG